MKFILVASLILSLPHILFSQDIPAESDAESYYFKDNYKKTDPSQQYIKAAGEYLQKHSRQYYLGLAIMGGGYALSIISINSESVELATIGGLAVIGGLVVQIISHKQIGKAGKMLEQSTQTVGHRIKIIGTTEMPGIGLALIF